MGNDAAVKDYSAMTGKELNVEIAHGHGLKMVIIEDKFGESWAISYGDDSGLPPVKLVSTSAPESVAWEHVFAYHWPSWSSSLDEAIKLWDMIPLGFIPRLVRLVTPKDGKLGFDYKSHIMTDDLTFQVEAYGETPALAICRAWLMYKDNAQSAKIDGGTLDNTGTDGE